MTRRVFAGSLLCAVAARAQNSKSQARGRELIDQSIAALGGQAFRTMQDRVEFGRAYSFYRERLSGLSIAKLYTRYSTPPRPLPESYYGLQERQAFGKKEDSAVFFSPEGGFEVTFRGVRPLPDLTVSRHQESTVTNCLYILRQRFDEPGLGFDARGADVIENQQVEAVDIYDAANRLITVYLSAQTKLPVMQRYKRFEPQYKEKIEEITRFSKYKDAGSGVLWPLDVQRERDGEKIYQMFSDTVTVNSHLDDKLFQLPRDMKILKKENF